MAYQSQSLGYVARKVQSALGSQASGSGATVLTTSGGQQGRLAKAMTASNLVRRDAMRTRGRHGTQKTSGSYSSEWSLGLADDILEAVMRGTWEAALDLDESDFTSITTGANSIVLASGSPITLGLRVGDVIRLSNHASSGNNGRNLRVTALDATTITVAETLTVNASPDTECGISRVGRKLINPAAGALVKRYFTVEEHELDIDGSEIFDDAVWGSVRFGMTPNGIITVDPTWVGTGKFETKTDSSAPHFSSPTEPTGQPMAVVDATLRLGSEDFVDLTAFDLTIDITPTAPDVFGSGAIKYAPDVFTGQMGVSLSFTSLRKDLARVADLLAETQLSFHCLAVDNESEPKDFLSLYVPNFTLGNVDKSALSKEGGPRTQTFAVPVDLCGIDTRGGAYDSTMVKIQVSNAS
jgi:hypothetical protein